jgi:hypothetical protein
VLYDIRFDRSVAAEGVAVRGDSRKECVDVVFNGDITTERRRPRETDVYVMRSHGTAEHRICRCQVRKERGGQSSTPVSRGKVGSTPGTRAGDRVLLEGQTGEAISGGFRIQHLPLHCRRLEKEEGYFTTFNRVDGAGFHSDECIRHRH